MTTVPMGFRIDPDLSAVENAQAAWAKQRDLQRAGNEKALREKLRRVLKMTNADELDVEFVDASPVSPVCDVGGELVTYSEDQLALVEYCGSCGREWRLRPFSSLTGFGRVLEARESAEAFECDTCFRLQAIGRRRK